MKRLYKYLFTLFFIIPLSTQLNANVPEDITEIIKNFMASDTFTLSIEKKDYVALSSSQIEIRENAQYQQVDLDFNDDKIDEKLSKSPNYSHIKNILKKLQLVSLKNKLNDEPADDDDSDSDGADDLPFETSLYLSGDKKTLYLFLSNDSIGYPSFIKLELRDNEGAVNTNINLYTNLSDEALSIKGSSSHEIHLSVNPLSMFFESLYGGYEDSDDVSDVQSTPSESNESIAKVIHSLAKKAICHNNSDSNTRNCTSDEDEDEGTLNIPNVNLSIIKQTNSSLLQSRNKLKANNDFTQATPNTYTSSDGSIIYLFIEEEHQSFANNYIRLELNKNADTDIPTSDIKVELNTTIEHEKLNFTGSNSDGIHVTFSPFDVFDYLKNFSFGELFSA